MKLKLIELVEAEAPLGQLIAKELPIKVAYWLGRNLKKIGSELKIYYDLRMKLFDKYGKKDETTNNINILPENIETFQKELAEILNEEIDIDIHKIKLEEFGDVKVSTQTMASISFMIEEVL